MPCILQEMFPVATHTIFRGWIKHDFFKCIKMGWYYCEMSLQSLQTNCVIDKCICYSHKLFRAKLTKNKEWASLLAVPLHLQSVVLLPFLSHGLSSIPDLISALASSHKTLQVKSFFHSISDNETILIFLFLSCAFGLQIWYLHRPVLTSADPRCDTHCEDNRQVLQSKLWQWKQDCERTRLNLHSTCASAGKISNRKLFLLH